jgi:hypothetical protein
MDLIYLAGIIGLFVITAALVAALERLRRQS